MKLEDTVRVAKSAKFLKKNLEMESTDHKLSKTDPQMFLNLLDPNLWCKTWSNGFAKNAKNHDFSWFFTISDQHGEWRRIRSKPPTDIPRTVLESLEPILSPKIIFVWKFSFFFMHFCNSNDLHGKLTLQQLWKMLNFMDTVRVAKKIIHTLSEFS